MAAALGNVAMLQHDDVVGFANRRQPVGDRHQRDAAAQRCQRLLHLGLGLAVDVGGGLVEQQDGRCAGQRTGHRDQLFLAHRQPGAALAQRRVVALRQPADEVVGMGGAGSGLDRGGVHRPAHRDVLARAGREQERLLRHQADRAPEVRVGEPFDGLTVDQQRAGRCRVEAQQQRQQRALAAAGVADDADELPGFDLQVQPVQHRSTGLVAKAQVAYRNPAFADSAADRGLRCLRFAEQGVDSRRSHHRLLQLRELHRDLDQRLDHPGDVADEGVEDADFQRAQPRGRAVVQAQAVDRDHRRQHRDVEKIQRGPQQPGVGAQFGAARVEMGLAGRCVALAECRRSAAGLDHRHAGNRLGGLGIDLAAQRTGARHRRCRQPLVEPDDRGDRGQQSGDDQHQPPVQQRHRRHHRRQHDRAV